MPRKRAVYSNAKSMQKLGEAFANMTGEKVSIPQRDCPDIPEFIRKCQEAQEATRKHRIKFG